MHPRVAPARFDSLDGDLDTEAKSEGTGGCGMTQDELRAREQELLEERAKVLTEAILTNEAFTKAVKEGLESAERGEGVPFKEVRAEWQKRHAKRT